MAMKRHRQGLNYSELLKLLSYKEIRYPDGYATHHTALARIVNGSMLLREQKVLVVPQTQPSLIGRTDKVTVCPHVSVIWNVNSQGLRGIVERIYPLESDLTKSEFKHLKGKLEAIIVTKWHDLGQGQSPMDYKWRSHVAPFSDRLWPSVVFGRGAVCAAFEGKEHFRFESDTAAF